MNSITDKFVAEKSSINSVSNFFDRFRLASELKRAGAYKQKGFSVSSIVKYLISLVYTGKSMFQDLRSETPLAQGFKKDVVYRFLTQTFINWQTFLLSVAFKIIAMIDKLTSTERNSAFVLDDSMYQVPYAKKTELVSKVYDHAEKGKNKYKWGFRMLTLAWTDGISLIPLAFRHLASSDKKNVRCASKEKIDKRSCAYKIRKEAVSKATEVLLTQLWMAIKAGIRASYVLFDSWFAYPITIMKIKSMGLSVVARVKDTTKIKYLFNGEKMTLKEIFRVNKKRRGKSRYLLSVLITLYATDDKGKEIMLPAKLVYVRNKAKRNEWIGLISTDLSLSEEDIIALYGKRWDIEVFFKVCKSYLKLTGEFHQLSYEAITAHTTVVMIRYMMLSVQKRTQEDPRSMGDLFFAAFDELSDIKFEQALILLMSLLVETFNDADLGLPEELVEEIMDKFIQKLPSNIRSCLCPHFGT